MANGQQGGMARMKFGAFLAPNHPIGEHPMLQFRNDIKFAQHLDELGFDEIWVGEHHSTGWDMIASPELFLAAVGERTQRIRLGTGVLTLPYHHPFNVAQRIVQLDHMTRGRVIFGTGPGALPSDAHVYGIDPMSSRDRQDEAIGVLKRLFAGERVTHESDWFTIKDARLQLLPLQENLPMVAASSISPSGMTLAGKYGMGVLSIGSNSEAGLAALPTQWGFAEQAAAKHGQAVDRANWRVLTAWHIAETREEARAQAAAGLMQWHNEYAVETMNRPGAMAFSSPDEAVDKTAFTPNAAAVIGTPDDLIAGIRRLAASAGGFGTVLGLAHDWANRENTLRSWDLVARYVIPEVNNLLEGYRASRKYVVDNSKWFERSGQAVMSKIMAHEGAAAALKAGQQAAQGAISTNTLDLKKATQEAK